MIQIKYVSKNELAAVRNLDCDPEIKAEIFATLCRINTLYMIRKAGSGHIGSSFSSLDIVSWLYLNELKSGDIYFSSKGHDVPGLYAVLTALDVIHFEKIHSLRRIGGLPGHPDVSIPGLPTNTGSLGMGISKAKGMAIENRLSGKTRRIYVMTGDGELQEGQVWESLGSAVNRNLHEITVIVDHNKLQSDIWVSQTSHLGDLEAKFNAFGWHVQRINGHDFTSFAKALNAARENTTAPSIIIADTVKGSGVSFMQHQVSPEDKQLYKYHSGAPIIEDYQAALDELEQHANQLLLSAGREKLTLESREVIIPSMPKSPHRLIKAYAEALERVGGERQDLVVLDADLKLDCGLIPFENQFPDRFVECGIAEQDMVSLAGGLALSGSLPVVHSFACFLAPRANEQIYNNATEKTKIIYSGSLAGLLPGGPGHSHQSVRDIDILSAVPGLNLVQPCCEEEVRMIVDYCVNTSLSSSYIRLTSIPVEIPFSLPAGYAVNQGQGCLIREGHDAIVFAYGPVMLSEAYNACQILADRLNVQVGIVNLPWLNSLDMEWFRSVTTDKKVIFTIDDHYVKGGQGEMIAAELARNVIARSVYSLGVTEIPACGTNDEVLAAHKLNTESIVDFIADKLKD